jgi:prophage regulatory protein
MTEAILRLPDVAQRVGLSRSSIYARLADADSDFPRPVQLGGEGSRAIGFFEREIDEWLANRPRGVRQPPARASQAA